MDSKSNTIGNTQAERLFDQLQEVRKVITRKDRELAREKFGITTTTLSVYLNKGIRDADLAAGLLTFFKGRIAQREKALQ